jgi:integrase
MTAARALTPALRAATFETLIGLLATTGIRIGEAMTLARDDIDWANRRLVVRDSKNGNSRELLLYSTTIDALARYAAQRDALSPDTGAASFFVSTRGTPWGPPPPPKTRPRHRHHLRPTHPATPTCTHYSLTPNPQAAIIAPLSRMARASSPSVDD